VAVNDPIETDLDDIGVLQLLPVDLAFVDEGSIRAGQVLEKQNFLNLHDPGVVSGYGRVLKAEIVIGLSADRE
jgi:hypothetical protein